jgi:hypothetical protein
MTETRSAADQQDAANPVPAVPTTVADLRQAQQDEYSQYVATSDIYWGNALAYRPGDPVPASNVKVHGYDKDKLVQKVKG